MTTTALDILIRARDEASSVIKGVESSSKSLGSKLDSVSRKMSSAGRTATTHLTLPILGIGYAAVKTEAEFSKTMNLLQASTGATGAEMKKLGDLAMKMGADTVFSANEAAEAMFELAKGGMTQAQIAAGGLKATLTLAAAGQIELADAATYVANALSMFGLAAKDAGQVGAALAGGANASTASVESLGLALSQVGPGAKRFGLSIQETVGVLASFEQAGIKGSDAGTSFKTFLQRLIPTTLKAKEEMKRLGFEFFDAKGEFIGIAGVAKQLQDKLGDLSTKERETAINILFGADASRAAGILMKSGADGVDRWTKATSNQNAAQKLANAGMKGTAGALERMKGSLETAGLALGKVLAPAVVQVTGYVERFANWISSLNKDQREWIVRVGALLAVLGPLLIVLAKVVTAVKILGAPIAKLNGGFKLFGKNVKLGTGSMLAWTAALTLAMIAADKIHGYLQKDDEAAKTWTKDIVFGKNSLQEYRTAVMAASEGSSHLARVLNGTQPMLDALGKTTREVTDAYMAFAYQQGATTDTSLAFQSVMQYAEGITKKEGRAIVQLMQGMHNLREPIDAVTLAQVSNLLAMGDAQGAIKLLTQKYRDAIGPLKNAAGETDNLASKQAEAAAKGELNAAAIRHQTAAARAAANRIKTLGDLMEDLAEKSQLAASKATIVANILAGLPKGGGGGGGTTQPRTGGGGGGGLPTPPGAPRLASGGYVSRTGLAVVHRGETYNGDGVGGRRRTSTPQKVVVRLDRRRFTDELAWDANFGNDF